MAKDDYDVVVFRILLYLYACKKRKIVFDQTAYDKAIKKDILHEDYLTDIYSMMAEEGYIEDVPLKTAWGNVKIPLFEERDLQITAQGIHYLTDNSKMQKVKGLLIEGVDTVASLITIAGLAP